MRRSFRESPPRIQFDHGHHPTIGSIPIAKLVRIAEEVDPDLAPEGGAHVVARMFDNWLMQPVRDAIAAGAIDGMSFRFGVVREQWHTHDGKVINTEEALMDALRTTRFEDVPDDELPVRTLKELKVPEIGPVVWLRLYRHLGVGAFQVIDLGRLNDPEQRRLLAEAVFLADTADSSQRSTAEPVVESARTPAMTSPWSRRVMTRSPPPPRGAAGERPSVPAVLGDRELKLRNQRTQLLFHVRLENDHDRHHRRGEAHRADPHLQPGPQPGRRSPCPHGADRRARQPDR